MSRERLMAQQRARLEARRKRLAEQKKKEQAKTKKKKTDYSSGSRLGTSRDTSLDKSRKAATTKRLTGGTTPLTGDAARKVLGIKPVGKVPSTPTTTTPTPKAKPAPQAKPSNRGKQRFFDGGKGGKFDDGTSRRTKSYAGVLPGTPEKKEKQQQTPKRNVRGVAARNNRASNPKTKPAKGSVKNIKLGNKSVTMIYNGSKWVPKK